MIITNKELYYLFEINKSLGNKMYEINVQIIHLCRQSFFGLCDTFSIVMKYTSIYKILPIHCQRS